MLIVEIAAAVLAAVAVLSWRYVLTFTALLLGIWLCLEKPVLALIIAAIAIPGVVITTRAARREAARRRAEEQMRAWNAVRDAAAQQRRFVRFGIRP